MKIYKPRLTGIGKQVMKQVLKKKMIKLWFPPSLRALIRKDTGCTDADIDKAFSGALETFDNEFNTLMAKQRAEMVPPPEKPCKHPGCKNHVTHPCEICGYQGDKNES